MLSYVAFILFFIDGPTMLKTGVNLLHQLFTTNYLLRTIYYELFTTNYLLRTIYYKL